MGTGKVIGLDNVWSETGDSSRVIRIEDWNALRFY